MIPAPVTSTVRVARRRPGRRPLKLAPGLVIGVVIVAVYLVAAVAAPLVAPADPLKQDLSNMVAAPSAEHLLGTDALGRDVLSRMIYAARIDLLVGFVGATVAFLIGGVLGLVAGYARGWVDVVLTRVMDVFQVLPSIVLIMLVMMALGAGTWSIIAAVVVGSWVAYARLFRAEVLVVRDADYAVAARLAGFGHARVLFRHVLPNVWLQAVTYLTTDIVLVITAVAALGYLGIGVQQPTPEWGAMIAAGQPYLATAPWLTIAPGLVVAVLGLGLALISDALTRHAKKAS